MVLTLDDMRESLYNLDRWELRRLAAEALLISDGPDTALEDEDPGNAVEVCLEGLNMVSGSVQFHMTIAGE